MADLKGTEFTIEGRQAKKVRLLGGPVDFKNKNTEGVKKLKSMGITQYQMFTYQGTVFTSHNAQFIEAVTNGELAEVDFIHSEGSTAEKKVIEVVDWLTVAEDNQIVQSDFKKSLLKVENFVSNPDLVTKVSDIEALINEA